MGDHDHGGVSRRRFLRTSAAGSAALLYPSCTGPAWTGGHRVRGACHHDCPDTCAWIVTTENGKAVALEGDPDHPYTRGTLCEKMDGFLTDVVYNPERLLHPLKRVGAKGEGRFEQASWDEALDAVATRLQQVIDEHGAEGEGRFEQASWDEAWTRWRPGCSR
jgi:anaerobic selenocysteine-containing dehydrogenase